MAFLQRHSGWLCEVLSWHGFSTLKHPHYQATFLRDCGSSTEHCIGNTVLMSFISGYSHPAAPASESGSGNGQMSH